MGSIKIGFGGGCHWCTEAIFQALKGVEKVEQGWIASTLENNFLSEAVILHFDETEIPLSTLIEIHLLTHSITSNHSMRDKYRSAVYSFNESQYKEATSILNKFQKESKAKIVTEIYPFISFKPSKEQFQDYYKKNRERPFCKTYIDPKLKLIMENFKSNLIEQ